MADIGNKTVKRFGREFEVLDRFSSGKDYRPKAPVSQVSQEEKVKKFLLGSASEAHQGGYDAGFDPRRERVSRLSSPRLFGKRLR